MQSGASYVGQLRLVPNVMNAAIVEDHLLLRDFVRKVCLDEPDIGIVAEAATGLEAVDKITRTRP